MASATYYVVGTITSCLLAIAEWLRPRVLELTYTAWDMRGFAADLGYEGPPFTWDEERRAQIRAEVDACFFHLYGLEHEDVAYVMDTFPIVERHDKQTFGAYRTKELILDSYDAMSGASELGAGYESILDPQPGLGLPARNR